MTVPPSPFIVSNSVGNTAAFVGRADVFDRVEAFLRQPAQTGLLLFGQRRIGKTSILHELRTRLPQAGPWVPVFMDLQGRASWTVDQILVELAEAITEELRLPPPRFGDLPRKEFRGWLLAVLQALPDDGRLVLIFDEFDVLTDREDKSQPHPLFPFLGRILENDAGGRLAAIYAIGRTMEDLDVAARPLLRGAVMVHVSTLARAEFTRLLDLGAQGGLSWGDGAQDSIWALTGGHPMLTQLIGATVWHAAHQSGVTRIEASTIDELTPAVLREARSILTWLWDGLTPACRVVSSALAEHPQRSVTGEQLEEILRDIGVRMVTDQLSSAPRLLRDWDLLDERDGEFFFKVEILRRWIQLYQPFSSVRRDLDKIVPAASKRYEAAVALWQGADDPDEDRVKRVINDCEFILDRMNPNHVGAALLLAEAYRHQHRLDDAIHTLERIYPIQPAAVRPRYVLLMLQRVEQLRAETDEEPRLALLHTILQVAPATHEAMTARTATWNARGARARAAGQLREAHECFTRADNNEAAAEVAAELERVDSERALAEILELEAQERYREALERLETSPVLAQHPGGVEALQQRLQQRLELADTYQRALAASEAGDRFTAISMLSHVLRLDPRHVDAAHRLRVLLDPPRYHRNRRLLFATATTSFLSLVLLLLMAVLRPFQPAPLDCPHVEPPNPEILRPPLVFTPKCEAAPVPAAALIELKEEVEPPPATPPSKSSRPPPEDARAPEPYTYLRNCTSGIASSCYSAGLHYAALAQKDARLYDQALTYYIVACPTVADACCKAAELYDGPRKNRKRADEFLHKARAGGFQGCLPVRSTEPSEAAP